MLNLKLAAISQEEFLIFSQNFSNQKTILERLPAIFSRAQEIIPLYLVSRSDTDKQRNLGSWRVLLMMIEAQNYILQYLLSSPLTQERMHYLKSFKKLEADLKDRGAILQDLKNSNHEKALGDLQIIFDTSHYLFQNVYTLYWLTDNAFDVKFPQQEKAFQILKNLAKTVTQSLKIFSLKELEAPEMETENTRDESNALMIPHIMVFRALLANFSEP